MSLLQSIGDAIGVEMFDDPAKNDTSKSDDDADVGATSGEEKKEIDFHDDTSISMKEDIAGADNKGVEITNLAQEVELEQRVEKADTKDDGSTSTSTSVSFGSVRVREYERVIDSTEKYMGLALGWNYNDMEPSPVLKQRNHASKYSVGGGSHGGDEKMKRTNGSDRYGMLVRYGYAPKELKQATKEAAQFYKERQRDAARSLVVAERNKQADPKKPKRRPLLRSMFG